MKNIKSAVFMIGLSVLSMALAGVVVGVSVYSLVRQTQTTTGNLSYTVKDVEATITGSAWYDDDSQNPISSYNQVITADTTAQNIVTWGVGTLVVPDFVANTTGVRKFTIKFTIQNTSSVKAIDVKIMYTANTPAGVSRTPSADWTGGITVAQSAASELTIVYSWSEDTNVSGLDVGFVLNMVGKSA
jgi:hypothetical protein